MGQGEGVKPLHKRLTKLSNIIYFRMLFVSAYVLIIYTVGGGERKEKRFKKAVKKKLRKPSTPVISPLCEGLSYCSPEKELGYARIGAYYVSPKSRPARQQA